MSKERLARLLQRLDRFRPRRLDHPFWTWELGDNWDLGDDDITRTLVEHRPSPLLFNRFPAARIMQDLERVGILARVRALGYREVVPTFGGEDMFENRFCLMAEHPDLTAPAVLIDFRTHQGELVGTCPISAEEFQVNGLILDWMSMQDPARPLPPDRLALPGQKHPGLGMFRVAYALVLAYFEELSLDVVLNIPQYFHNAVLYSPRFQFFVPQRQGRFLAMQRDLLAGGLATASHALEQSQVELVGANPPRHVRWTPAEQMFAMSETLRGYLKDRRYRRQVSAEKRACHYRAAPGFVARGRDLEHSTDAATAVE